MGGLGNRCGAIGQGAEADLVTSSDEYADLLAAVAQERDRDAFVRLFDHFAPRLNSYYQRLGLDASASEELAQDVMATLWRKAHLFDRTKSSVPTWLFRIARNRWIDSLRRDRMRGLEPGDPLSIPDNAMAADDSLDLAGREERLRAALEALPAEQRELVHLSFFEGLPHTVIAERTGLPLGTVKSRIRLAFSRLRRLLALDDPESTH
jgi:RNA polymerase sigma factor (sigma-70 family)